MKTGILLINLGTPDSPSVADVRKYLTQFLNDPFVMDIHPIARFFLVNFIIVPFRAPKSAKLYEQIWTVEGSPLLIYTKKLKEKLQKELECITSRPSVRDKPSPSPPFGFALGEQGEGSDFVVEFGMRYQNPSIHSAFKKLKDSGVEKIIAIPLYPQYASSSTGSTITELKRVMKKENFSNVKIIEHFYRDENFLNSWVEVAKKYLTLPFAEASGGKPSPSPHGEGSTPSAQSHDFFLFSYHGLPERQIKKVYPDYCKINLDCCSAISRENHLCYRAACYETTRQLVKKLNIPEGKYTTSFQSRLNDKWLKPYSDKVVEENAKSGVKKMLVFSPAFVADCLETIYEIGIEYEVIFKKNGGERLTLVESLNDSEKWVNCLKEIISP